MRIVVGLEDFLTRSLTLILSKEVCSCSLVSLWASVIRSDSLGGNGTDRGGVVVGATLCKCLFTGIIGGVEVGLDVGHSHGGIGGGGSGRPEGISIAPVIQEHATTLGRDVLVDLVQELAIDVESDAAGGPVEAVLVELLVGSEGERGHAEFVSAGCVITMCERGWGLENEVDSALGIVELLGEELHVNLL